MVFDDLFLLNNQKRLSNKMIGLQIDTRQLESDEKNSRFYNMYSCISVIQSLHFFNVPLNRKQF
jgi:hypothetical protein